MDIDGINAAADFVGDTGDDGNDGDTDAKEENAGGDSGEDADGDCW